MSIKQYILLFLTLLMAAACSYIGEDEQLIYVAPEAAKRVVLLEDYTGQRCINCPNASDVIADLHNSFGADSVIAVAIHAGPLAFYTNTKFLGLRTQTGDEYYNHWNLEYQPIGLINRSAPVDYTLWATKVREELQKTSPLTISLNGLMTDDKTAITLNAVVTGMEEMTIGHLQLWLIEDDITAFQLMPDGTRKDDYHHRHVFRAAINGDWGEEIKVGKDQTVSVEHNIPLKEDWNAERISVVAFVYTDAGVIQAKQFNF